MYYFSNRKRLKKGFLFSMICNTYTLVSGPQHDGNADPNIDEDDIVSCMRKNDKLHSPNSFH
jgi:hypothetical protein